jgi:hypothetical protein
MESQGHWFSTAKNPNCFSSFVDEIKQELREKTKEK